MVTAIRGLTSFLKGSQPYRVSANLDTYISLYIPQRYRYEFRTQIEGIINQIENLRIERKVDTLFDLNKFEEALMLCLYAHRNQTRKTSSKPYAIHPITLVERAVNILHITDGEELIAGLLHDVVEDTKISLDYIRKRFGNPIADLVDGLTEIERLERDPDKLIDEENIDKLLNAIRKDIRVLRIKIIDRGTNLEDAEKLPDEDRIRLCQEALDFYVPLGVLCGFMKAARHLSDIAFKKLNSDRYNETNEAIAEMKKNNEELLEELKIEIEDKYRETVRQNLAKDFLSKLDIRKYLPKRLKSLVDSYTGNSQVARLTKKYIERLKQKLVKDFLERVDIRKYLSAKSLEILTKPRTVYEVDQIATISGTDAKELSDIVMMQVTVKTVEECYAMVNIIHSLGIPVDRFWHDYIKDPKINGYQSLHTGIQVGNTRIRFQIRTHEMQKIAQEGVLHNAHKSGKFKQPELSWLKAEWLKIILTVRDRREKIKLTKSLSQARLATVLVKGRSVNETYRDVILPRGITPEGITPLEAAFIADPSIGLRLVYAVNLNEPRDLNKPIREGIGFIEFHAADEIQPRDYFSLLKEPLARYRLIDFLKSQKLLAYQLQFASQILGEELRKAFLSFEDLVRVDPIEVKKLLLKILNGELSAEEAAHQIRDMVRNAKGDILALARLDLEVGENTPEILDGLSDILPIRSDVTQGTLRRFSLEFRSKAQDFQFNNFLNALRNDSGIKIERYQKIEPPIIDPDVLDPKSIHYSHEIAIQAAIAIQKQKGGIPDITINPPELSVVDGLPQQFGADTADHFATAGIIFISGLKKDILDFRKRLTDMINRLKKSHKHLVDEDLADPNFVNSHPIAFPFIVLFERRGFHDDLEIAHPLKALTRIPTLNSFGIGHTADYLLNRLEEKFASHLAALSQTPEDPS